MAMAVGWRTWGVLAPRGEDVTHAVDRFGKGAAHNVAVGGHELDAVREEEDRVLELQRPSVVPVEPPRLAEHLI